MSQLTQLRIVGYAAIMAMHVINIFYMDWHKKRSPSEDKRVLAFMNLDYRFLTTWTFMLQIAYAFFCLICDIIILKNSRKQSYTLPKYVTEFRETIFSAIVWPSSWGNPRDSELMDTVNINVSEAVFTIFWGLFYYDRSLIFPEYLDVFLAPVSNHVIHTTIVPIVLFEVMSRPRIEPSTHSKNMAITTLYIGSYLSVLLFTYKERNVWLYPIFEQLYGSVYFLFLLAVIYGLFIGFYVMQWPISNMIYMEGTKKTRHIQRRKKRV